MLPSASAVGVDQPDGLDRIGQEMLQWYPDSNSPFDTTASSATASNVVQGYKDVKLLGDYFVKLFDNKNSSSGSPRQQALITVQEFGTLPTLLVGRALIVENAAYHHLSNDEALVWAKRVLRPAFYPNRPEWRRQILERGVRALLQSMKRSIHHATTPTPTTSSSIEDGNERSAKEEWAKDGRATKEYSYEADINFLFYNDIRKVKYIHTSFFCFLSLMMRLFHDRDIHF
jgi:hypothetical protein